MITEDISANYVKDYEDLMLIIKAQSINVIIESFEAVGNRTFAPLISNERVKEITINQVSSLPEPTSEAGLFGPHVRRLVVK